MSLIVSVLGPFQATYNGQPLVFATDATRALLAYLAIEGGQPHLRAGLAALLWPDQPQVAAFANLRQTLARLRKALPEPAIALLHVRPQTLQLQRDGVTIDHISFEELLAQCAAHDHTNLVSCSACAGRLREAIELYRGELLYSLDVKDSQPFEEWLLVRREMLRRQALDALYTLTRQAENAADYGQMRQYAARQLALEPWREEAHRQLMLALTSSGQRTAALAQYETCRRILAQELGIEPEVETQLLYERIRDNTFAPATLRAHLPAQNLPTQLTPFVGRERELAEIAARLQQPDVRLLTLIGAGGMGKTRLALETARALLDAFPDGVFFVALAPITSASAIAAAIVAAMGLSLGGDPEQALPNALRDKQVLLILDNFEHVIEGVGLVVQLLQAAPRLQLLVTSREQLTLRGEHLYQVQPMEDAAGATLSDVANSSALRLFTQSAQRVQSTFQLSEANLAAVLRICQLVQGMPLGLELAAAWAGSMPLDEIADEITQSADFLASEWRDAPERQRSMRGVFDWSWKLLDAAEREVFRQLSVFCGGFTREAAQTIVGTSLRVLTGLIHKSLLRRGAAGRYEIHELLRQFAAEQLAIELEEQAAVETRHSTYYLAFLAQREMRLARNQPREAAMEIQGEIDNIRQAWRHAAMHALLKELDTSVYGMWQFYMVVGLLSEGEASFRLAADSLAQRIDAAMPTSTRQAHQRLFSIVRAMQAYFLEHQGKYDQTILVAQQAIALGNASQEPIGSALGYDCWGQALFRKGDRDAARPHLEHALHLVQDAQTSTSALLREVEWDTLIFLGILDEDAGDYTQSKAHFTQALQITHNLGMLRGECRCLLDLGELALIVGDYAAATTSFQAGLRLARAHGAREHEGIALMALGMVALAEGDYASAYDASTGALTVFTEIGYRLFEAYTLAYLGRLADSVGDYVHAREWLERVFRLTQDVGSWEPHFYATVFLALLLQHTGENELARQYAEQSLHISVPLRQSDAWLALARTHEALEQPPEAIAAYQQALAHYDAFGRAHMATEPHAGLARLALAHDDLQQALVHVEAILLALKTQGLVGPDEPFRIYLTCYRVLAALEDPRATDVLHAAQQRLREQADRINDTTLRHSFLENVATHRELLRIDTTGGALAAASSGDVVG